MQNLRVTSTPVTVVAFNAVTNRTSQIWIVTYLQTGDLVATSKQAGHTTTKMTEQVYIDVLKKHKANIELPNA